MLRPRLDRFQGPARRVYLVMFDGSPSTPAMLTCNDLAFTPNFGRIFNAKNPREMRFGLRLVF